MVLPMFLLNMGNKADDMKHICSVPVDQTSLDAWRFWMMGVLMVVCSSFGLSANILAIACLAKKCTKSLFYCLLCVLCTSNILLLLSNLGEAVEALVVSDEEKTSRIFAPWRLETLPVFNLSSCFFLTSSVFLTVAVTMERHHAYCRPTQYHVARNKRSMSTRLALYVLPSLLFALLLSLPRAIQLTPLAIGQSTIDADSSSILRYQHLQLFYLLLHPLTTTVIAPTLLLLVLNYNIISRIHSRNITSKFTRKMEQEQARLSIAAICVFLVHTVPRVILLWIEVDTVTKFHFCLTENLKYNPSEAMNIFFYVANLSTLVNSSLNFFIYCFACEGFRTSFKDLIRTLSTWRRPTLMSQSSEVTVV